MDEMKLLMDAVERLESGTSQLHGTIIINGQERLSEDAEKNQMEIAKIASRVTMKKLSLAHPAGVALWSARKKTLQIHMRGNGVVIVWRMFNRKNLCVLTIDTSKSVAITKLMEESGWNQICGMMLYSYMRI